MLIVALDRASRSIGYDSSQHVGHQISGLHGEHPLRTGLVLIDDFALGVHNLLNHIRIIEFALVSDG
ncbi:hypothetical protein D3C71_1356080 [compost metagenome]